MDGQYSSMAALGRRFELGDFYNYRADCILKGNLLSRFKFVFLSIIVNQLFI